MNRNGHDEATTMALIFKSKKHAYFGIHSHDETYLYWVRRALFYTILNHASRRARDVSNPKARHSIPNQPHTDNSRCDPTITIHYTDTLQLRKDTQLKLKYIQAILYLTKVSSSTSSDIYYYITKRLYRKDSRHV